MSDDRIQAEVPKPLPAEEPRSRGSLGLGDITQYVRAVLGGAAALALLVSVVTAYHVEMPRSPPDRWWPVGIWFLCFVVAMGFSAVLARGSDNAK